MAHGRLTAAAATYALLALLLLARPAASQNGNNNNNNNGNGGNNNNNNNNNNKDAAANNNGNGGNNNKNNNNNDAAAAQANSGLPASFFAVAAGAGDTAPPADPQAQTTAPADQAGAAGQDAPADAGAQGANAGTDTPLSNQPAVDPNAAQGQPAGDAQAAAVPETPPAEGAANAAPADGNAAPADLNAVPTDNAQPEATTPPAPTEGGDPGAGATPAVPEQTAPPPDPNAAATPAAPVEQPPPPAPTEPAPVVPEQPAAPAVAVEPIPVAIPAPVPEPPTPTPPPPAQAPPPPEKQDAPESGNGGSSNNAGPPVSSLPEDNLPPGPPLDWRTLPADTQIIFGMQLQGPYLVPWTKAKSWAFNNVLQQRYLRSCDINDIETGPLLTFAVPAPPAFEDNGRRRLSRRLLQESDAPSAQLTGVTLRVKVKTNSIRVESEVRTVADGVSSGSLKEDLSTSLGAPVTNITLSQQPTTLPYDKLPDPNANSGGSIPSWAIGVIVGCILVFAPVPAYIIYRRHQRKHLEAVEKQAAEAAAARQRMQSRVIKPGGKSFSMQRGTPIPNDGHDILVQSGSIGGGSFLYTGGASRVPSAVDMSRPGSVSNMVMGPIPGASRTPPGYARSVGGGSVNGSFTAQQQRAAIFQQQSGAYTPSRVQAIAGARQLSGVVHPVSPLYGDEASSSSGGRSTT